jgi:Tfp pilus assembly protein PilX
MNASRRRVRSEDGFVVPVAIIILFVTILIGLAVMSTVDAQTHQSGYETSGEAAYNLGESVLNSEAKQVQSYWPTASQYTTTYTSICTNTTVTSAGCPGSTLAAMLNSTYAGKSFGNNVSWSATVLDDNTSVYPGAANYYDNSLYTSGSNYHYDQNGDNKLWIRVSATSNGQTRVVVQQIRRIQVQISLPQSTITAGAVQTSNNGNKIIVNSEDPSNSVTGPVNLNCNDTTGTMPSTGDWCAGWDASHTIDQLYPPSDWTAGYTDPGTTAYQTLSSSLLSYLQTTAEANGTFYANSCSGFTGCSVGCPPQGTAGIVFAHNLSCSYSTNGGPDWDSATSPGMIIFDTGTVSFTGNENIWAVVYMENLNGATPCTQTNVQTNNPIFSISGGAILYGGVFVDNCGTVYAGDSAGNIQFFKNSFGGTQALGTPSLVKDSFRVYSG